MMVAPNSTVIAKKVEGGGKANAQTPFPKFNPGTKLWVPCPDQVWKKCDVIRAEEFKLLVRDLTEDQDIEIGPNTNVYMRNEDLLDQEGLIALEDLTQLNHLHEAEVLNSLNIRFDVDKIYTFTGSILIAVNPFKRIPGIYDEETLKHFLAQGWNRAYGGERKPHVFDTANQAYRGLCGEATSQTILISGESGAGKTESTKFVMKLLAMAGSKDWTNRSLIENQVLQSNPLLEAFGNAKTLRNDNSSRFGKFIEMQFQLEPASGSEGRVGRLAGARIHTYLLETVRVCRQLEGERNYHAFYQLAAAASRGARPDGKFVVTPDKAAALGIKLEQPIEYDFSAFGGADRYRYLTRSSCMTLNSVDDLDEFAATTLAMHTIGISVEEQRGIWSLVGAILHLGNIAFECPEGQSESSAVAKVSQNAMEITANLLGLSSAKLGETLCCRYIRTRNESFKKPLTVSEAEDTRDALCRALYGTMFLKIVKRTNQSIGYVDCVKLFCGVLDIFGFECFQWNSFEQICINFTNERLQHFFNNFVFKCEQQLYEQEDIPWDPLDFPDNQDCVELLQMKVHGVFPMLDEECFVPKGSDKSYCSKLRDTHKDHVRFCVIKTKAMWFGINHFAGPVNYCVEGFVEKNKDQLYPDVSESIKNSSNPFVADCFQNFLVRDEAGNNNQQSSPDLQKVAAVKKKQVTVSSEFRQQLNQLMGTVEVTVPHFIRCIKPNPQNKPDIFDRKSVTEQLRNNGVLQAVQVSRAGYPVRNIHAEFYKEYRALLNKEERSKAEGMGEGSRNQVQYLLDVLNEKLKIPKPKHAEKSWAVGRTQVFLKHEAFEKLSDARAVQRSEAAIKIQAFARMWLQRRLFRHVIRQVVVIQSGVRMWQAKLLVKKLRSERAAIKIQSAYRRHKARQRFLALRETACFLGCMYKAWFMHSELLRIRKMVAAIKIWRWYLSCLERIESKRRDFAATKIQTMVRGKMARNQKRKLAAEARNLDNVQKQLAEIQAKARAAEAEKEKLREEAEALRLAELKQAEERMKESQQGLSSKLEELEAENEQLKAQIVEKDQQIAQLKEKIESVAGATVDLVQSVSEKTTAVGSPIRPDAVGLLPIITTATGDDSSPSPPNDDVLDVATFPVVAEPATAGSAPSPQLRPGEDTARSLALIAGGAAAAAGAAGGARTLLLPSQSSSLASPPSSGTSARAGLVPSGSSIGVSNLSTCESDAKLSKLEMEHAKLKQEFHTLQGQISGLPLPLPEEFSRLWFSDNTAGSSPTARAGKAGAAGLPSARQTQHQPCDLIVCCHLKETETAGRLLLKTLLPYATGDDEQKINNVLGLQTNYNGPITLFVTVPTPESKCSLINKVWELTSPSTSNKPTRPSDSPKSYPLSVSVWDIDQIMGLSPEDINNTVSEIGNLSNTAFHFAFLQASATNTNPEYVDLLNQIYQKVAPHCGISMMAGPASKDVSFPVPQYQISCDTMTDVLSQITADCCLRRAELIGFLQSSSKPFVNKTAQMGRTGASPDGGDHQKPSFLQNLKNLLPGLPSQGGAGGVGGPYGQGISSSMPGSVSSPNQQMNRSSSVLPSMRAGNQGGFLSARALAERFLRPSFHSDVSNPELAKKIQISAVYKEEHNRGPITCVRFGREHKHKSSYTLAVAFKSGRIFLYRIGRAQREMELFEEETFNYGQTASTLGGGNVSDLDQGGGAGDGSASSTMIEEITPLRALEGHGRAVTSLFFTADDDQVVSTSIDCTVKFWEVRRGYLLKVFTDAVPILIAAFLPSTSDIFLTSNTSAVIRLVHSTSGRILQKFKSDNEVRAVCFDHVGSHCIAGLKDGHLQIYEIDAIAKKFNYRKRFAISKSAITSVLFCPPTLNRSSFLIVNSCDNNLTIVDVNYKLPAGDIGSISVRQRCQIRHATIPLSSALVCQSEDETFIATPSEDGTVMIYGCVAQSNGSSQLTLLHGLRVHRAPVVTVGVNSTSTLLISADTHGDIVFWRRQFPVGKANNISSQENMM